MIKVYQHGATIVVENPVTREKTEMVNITFIEEGRSGADVRMSETSKFLSDITGEEVGLSQLRTHTQPVLRAKASLFPIGKEFPGHINRGLYSTPQITQQVDKAPREIDGKPTYFKTWISQNIEEDMDFRLSTDVIATVNPNALFSSQVGAARVERSNREVVVPQSVGSSLEAHMNS